MKNKIIVGIIFIILVMAGIIRYVTYTNSDVDYKQLEALVLQSSKDYSIKNNIDLAIGDCATMPLETLIDYKKLDGKNFEKCDIKISNVKVCKLENGELHYVSNLICNKKELETYDNWIKLDKLNPPKKSDDIRYTYLPQKIDEAKVVYGSNQTLWEDEIITSGYKLLETKPYYRFQEQEYKWKYDKKVYWNKGAYSDVMPKGYTNKESEKQVPFYSRRTSAWKEVANPMTDKKLKAWYICTGTRDDKEIISEVKCEKRTDNYKVKKDILYTCTEKLPENFADILVNKDASCKYCTTGSLATDEKSCGNYVYGNWSSYTTSKCSENALTCRIQYKTASKWYQLVQTTSDYLKEAPTKEAIKTGDNKYSEWSNYTTKEIVATPTMNVEKRNRVTIKPILDENSAWVSLSSDYVTKEDAIKLFNTHNYNVNILNDVVKNGSIRYKLKLEYRNRNN